MNIPLWPNLQVEVSPSLIQLSPSSLLEPWQLHGEGNLEPCPIHPLLAVGEPCLVGCEPLLLTRLQIYLLF